MSISFLNRRILPTCKSPCEGAKIHHQRGIGVVGASTTRFGFETCRLWSATRSLRCLVKAMAWKVTVSAYPHSFYKKRGVLWKIGYTSSIYPPSQPFGKKNIGWIDNFCVVVQVLGLGYDKGKHVWFMDAVHMFWTADWFRVESTKVENVTGNVWSMHQCNGLTWQKSGHYASWN